MTKTLAEFETLAKAARPENPDECGSQRQVAALSAFMQAVNPYLDEYEAGFSDYCLIATADDMIDEALNVLAITLSRPRGEC
jgi:hypothetical protein